jgi:hypothetical protein
VVLSHGRILDGLADTLEALDTTAYGWPGPAGSATTDRWKRGRTLDAERAGARHLAFWIDLGDAQADGNKGLRWDEASLTFTARFSPSGDYAAEARFRDAAAAAMLALLHWSGMEACRATPTGYSVGTVSGEWAQVRVRFTLHHANWRA